jgi:hypothetical protein
LEADIITLDEIKGMYDGRYEGWSAATFVLLGLCTKTQFGGVQLPC